MTDTFSINILEIAVNIGNEEECKRMINLGVDVNILFEYNNNLLIKMFMLPYNYFNLNIFKLLIDNGCNVNCENIHGITPLYCALSSRFCCRYYEAIEYLIQHGANMNLKTKKLGFTPLHLICEKDAIYNEINDNDLYKICVLLVENGADILAKNNIKKNNGVGYDSDAQNIKHGFTPIESYIVRSNYVDSVSEST